MSSVLKPFVVDLKVLQVSLDKISGDLGREEELFLQYYRLQKNQHRRGVYFHKLSHVRRFILKESLLSLYNFIQDIEGLAEKSTNIVSEQVKQCFSLFNEAFENIIKSTLVIEKAVISLSSLVQQGFFVAFAMTCIAMLSRMHFLLSFLLPTLESIANQIGFMQTHLALAIPQDAKVPSSDSESSQSEDLDDIFSVLD